MPEDEDPRCAVCLQPATWQIKDPPEQGEYACDMHRRVFNLDTPREAVRLDG